MSIAISDQEANRLEQFRVQMKKLLDANTHKGAIIAEGCDYPFIYIVIQKNLLVLLENSYRFANAQDVSVVERQYLLKSCVDVANLAFIYYENVIDEQYQVALSKQKEINKTR